ncbi:MAG: zinc-ribbon domain-containing protein [Candidatus Pelethousia sp.]|nr:zinc-ribbon domain-containing protein [Candidatus Pelethousia sp.]
MAHCTNCGTQLQQGVKFCPSCGAVQNGPDAYQAPVMQTAPASMDAQNNKAMGVLAYLGILVLIPIFAAKDSKFARFHANQGLVLAIAEIAFSILYSILVSILASLMFSTSSFGLFSIVTTLLGLLWLVFPVLAIIGIVNVVKGITKELPVIGNIQLLK